jgi:hypothetical protein
MAGGTKSRTYNETKGGGGNNLVVPFVHSVRNVEAPTVQLWIQRIGYQLDFWDKPILGTNPGCI